MVGGVVAIMVKSVIIVEAKHAEPSFILGDWMLTEYKLLQSEYLLLVDYQYYTF